MTSPTVDRRFGLVGNAAIKAPVAAVATTNVTLSGQQTIDGQSVLATNSVGIPDRVLCVGQTDATQNGLYDVSLNAWSRSADGDGPYDFAQGSLVFVNNGATYAGTAWYLTTAAPITVGTTALTWHLGVGVNLLTAVQAALAYSLQSQNSAAQAAAIVLGKFLQNGTGAVQRTFLSKAQDVVDARDFGLVANDATKGAVNLAAIQAAVASGACIITLPYGTIDFSDTLLLLNKVLLVGQGVGRLDANTYWRVPTGKTAIRIERGLLTYGDDSWIKGISFDGTARNTTATTGTMTAASAALTLAAAQDFATGQMVLVRGAGDSHVLAPSWFLSAATTAGSPNVTLSQTGYVHPGMVLSIAGAAFPAGTYVVSRGTTDVIMSANATNTVAAGAITHFTDLCAQILSGGGTTALTLNEAAVTAVTGAVVEHYDCGVYSQSRAVLQNLRCENMNGATVYIHSGHGQVIAASGQTTNGNNFLVEDIHAGQTTMRNLFRVHGVDANAGSIYNCVSLQTREYGYIDYSFLGNNYFGCHASGGYGYLTVLLNAACVFTGCYREGGTCNAFAARTLVQGGNMGGTIGNAEGGAAILVDNGGNLITGPIKPFSGNYTHSSMTVGQSGTSLVSVASIDASGDGGDSTMPLARSSTASGDGASGLWGWWPGSAAINAGMLWPDSGHPSGHASGSYHRNGVNIGFGTGAISTGNFRKHVYSSSPPSSGVRGDVLWNNSPSSGTPAAWQCTVSSTSAATWRVLAYVTTASS